MIITSVLKRNLAQTGQKENVNIAEDQRVQELKKRFNNLGVTVEKTKRTQIERIEISLTNLQNHINQLMEDQSVLNIKKSLTDLQGRIEEIHIGKDNFDDIFYNKLGHIMEEFRVNLDDIRADNRVLVSEFSKQGIDRLFAFGLSFGKNQNAFQDQLNAFSLNVEERIDFMREQIERENQEREEGAERVEIHIMGQLDLLEEEIVINNRVKNDTTQKIRSLIKDMTKELDKKIEHEKREREQSNNSLLLLLEEACSRIERNVSVLM